MIIGLNHIISGFKKTASKAIYENLFAKTEKWAELIYIANVKVTLPCLTIPDFVKSFYVYFTTDVGGDAFQLPVYAWWATLFRNQNFYYLTIFFERFPFDWKNPCGYLIAFGLICSGGFYLVYFASCIISLFIGTSFVLVSIIKDMKLDLRSLQIEEGKGKAEEFKQTLFEFVDLYCETRELSKMNCTEKKMLWIVLEGIGRTSFLDLSVIHSMYTFYGIKMEHTWLLFLSKHQASKVCRFFYAEIKQFSPISN